MSTVQQQPAKKWYKSKTLLFNLALTLGGLAFFFLPNEIDTSLLVKLVEASNVDYDAIKPFIVQAVDGNKEAGLFIAGFGVVNIILRLITHKEIAK